MLPGTLMSLQLQMLPVRKHTDLCLYPAYFLLSTNCQSSQLMFASDAYIPDSMIYARRNFHEIRHHMIYVA